MFTHRRTAQGSLYQAEARPLSLSLSMGRMVCIRRTPRSNLVRSCRWIGGDRKSIGESIRNTRRLPRTHSPSQICSIVCVKLQVFLIKRNGTDERRDQRYDKSRGVPPSETPEARSDRVRDRYVARESSRAAIIDQSGRSRGVKSRQRRSLV